MPKDKETGRVLQICFPIVWCGLIAKRTGSESGTQINVIRTLFPDMHDEKPTVNHWIRNRKAFSAVLANDLFFLESNGEIGTIVNRIDLLTINPIRNVVSAFHHYLHTHDIRVGAADVRAMEEALKENNPEKYIAVALLAGLRYRHVQPGLTTTMLDELYTIEQTTEYPDAFAVAKGETEIKNVPDDVQDAELWQKVQDVLRNNPEAFDKLTLSNLKVMTMDDLYYLSKMSIMMLWVRHHDVPVRFPVIFNTAGFDTRLDVNYYYYVSSPELFMRLEALGLIAHPRMERFRTWRGENEGAVLISPNLQQCMIIRALECEKDFFSETFSLTEAGMRILETLALPLDYSPPLEFSPIVMLGVYLTDLLSDRGEKNYKITVHPIAADDREKILLTGKYTINTDIDYITEYKAELQREKEIADQQ